jgi:hypothetical protein
VHNFLLLYHHHNVLHHLCMISPPSLADFLNWMPSNDDGDAEEIQEAADAAAAASYQGI